MNIEIPLSLYIHFPWCVKKCPYCDFNSHTLKTDLPIQTYVASLIRHLLTWRQLVGTRPIISIFMGGGTPSLFPPYAISQVLTAIKAYFAIDPQLEVTLEANPGALDSEHLAGYFQAGVNRISLGVQSFNDSHLKALGRIHHAEQVYQAVEAIKQAGFTNFNLDLMFGLPKQTREAGLADLTQGLALAPSHLSWYELTLEPNTQFAYQPPSLPSIDAVADLQEIGQRQLAQAGFEQYEISAYSLNKPCLHNLNYWEFGDYMAIGAGSHAKLTQSNGQIMRYQHYRHPKDYLTATDFIQHQQPIEATQLAFEYFLNTLRLKAGAPLSLFTQRTGLPLTHIAKPLEQAVNQGWLTVTDWIKPTSLGYRFLNDVNSLFLNA